MLRAAAVVVAFAGLVGTMGCGRNPLPVNSTVPKNRAELESRYDALTIGVPEAEVAAFMGKNGAQVAGFSTQVLKHMPQGGSWESTPGQTDKYTGPAMIRPVRSTSFSGPMEKRS